jgi:Cu(I)/Ag(I) efflux system membrane protein CusA/SilA
MIESIIAWSARNKFLVYLATFFAIGWGVWAAYHTPLDAIPDLSDVQVIVFTEWKGRSPDLVEDQITYPIVTALLSAPRVKVVRGYSFFGLSFVYTIFDDGTDIYWARSRVLEYLQSVQGDLPPGITPTLGPDATGVGWAFEYVLVDKTGQHDLAQLRSLQDWHVRYWLESVPGVAEVASVGGFVKQYQVDIDPNKLVTYRVPINRVIQAIRRSNNDVGGRIVELSGREHMVRGLGYIRNISDLEQISLGASSGGAPIYLRDVANIHLGPDIRRGLAEWNGEGQVVGGIVVMRYGENALSVIERVKEKIEEVRSSLPEGVEIVPAYDRSDLILRSIDNLKEKLLEEMLIVSLVCLVFLFHFRSSLVIIITLPVAILLSLVAMYYSGLNSNIMSLGGIAIAVGAMIDGSIVMVENAHKHLEQWKEGNETGSRAEVIIHAAQEVGRAIFFALLIITVSFLPVFTLEAQEGRLFKPLAYTKTFAMFFAAVLAITLGPVLMLLLVRGRILPEHKNPVSRVLIWIYQPFARLVLTYRKTTLLLGLLAVLTIVPVWNRLGTEFMPPLWEGSLLYMPVGLPSLSIAEVDRVMQQQDKILQQFPEVVSVFGKAGRARTATDPAPLAMIETTVVLKPESEWRPGLTPEALINEMDAALQIPGISNSWTQPIIGRIDMLTTGVRTPVGVKILGPDLKVINGIGSELEQALRNVPGTRNIFAERVTGGAFFDIHVDRGAVARYGLTVGDVQDVVETAIGGKNIATTIEGRERYPINVRYARELRDDRQKIERVLVATPSGAMIPLAQLARLEVTNGPPVIKSEDGELMGLVFVDVAGRDLGSYVSDAKEVIANNVELPGGYHLVWSGQYENLQRAQKRMAYVIPLTLFLIFLLLYLSTRSIPKVIIVLLAVPFSLIGAFWIVYLLGYNLSIAVAVGLIALAGVDAETGVVMLLYLDLAYHKWRDEGRITSELDLEHAVLEGAVKRVRPKMMTVMAILMGLLPIMWGTGAGSDVMKRIAAPMVGGIVTSFILELLLYPVIFTMWKWNSEVKPELASRGLLES